jgi:hypothetical protein
MHSHHICIFDNRELKVSNSMIIASATKISQLVFNVCDKNMRLVGRCM